MDLRTALLQEHSKAQAAKIAAYIGKDTQRFAQLMELFLHGEYRITQRAAWVVGQCALTHPTLIQPYLAVLISNLREPVHDAVKRNTVRILQHIPIPEALWGELTDICFGFLTDAKTAIAIKVFSMTILLHIAQQMPDLKHELKLVIEEQLPHGSSGFISRAQKVLKALEKC